MVFKIFMLFERISAENGGSIENVFVFCRYNESCPPPRGPRAMKTPNIAATKVLEAADQYAVYDVKSFDRLLRRSKTLISWPYFSRPDMWDNYVDKARQGNEKLRQQLWFASHFGRVTLRDLRQRLKLSFESTIPHCVT